MKVFVELFGHLHKKSEDGTVDNSACPKCFPLESTSELWGIPVPTAGSSQQTQTFAFDTHSSSSNSLDLASLEDHRMNLRHNEPDTMSDLSFIEDLSNVVDDDNDDTQATDHINMLMDTLMDESNPGLSTENHPQILGYDFVTSLLNTACYYHSRRIQEEVMEVRHHSIGTGLNNSEEGGPFYRDIDIVSRIRKNLGLLLRRQVPDTNRNSEASAEEGRTSFTSGSSETPRNDNVAKFSQHKLHFSYEEIIGQGSTSIIYKGSFGALPAAVKRIKSELVDVYENELRLWVEMKRTCEVDNSYIVTLYDWAQPKEEIDRPYYLVMELAKCDLGKRIKELKETNERNTKQIIRIIQDAARGLKWIHDRDIIHRDIKPANILIFEKVSGEEMAKVADFGISRKLSGMSTGTNSVGKGSSDWMAPEALVALRDRKTFYSRKAIDIFSLGMTASYALTLGEHPFGESEKYGAFINMNIIDENVKPRTVEPQHYAQAHLLKWMMRKEATERPNINQVLQHPAFLGWEKSLQFLVDVAQTFHDKNYTNLMKIRKKIDDLYLEQMLLLGENTSWKLKINARLLSLLFQRKSNGGDKYYDGESVMMLVELIRDKYVHYQDLVPQLLSDEFFGECGFFSEEKYIQHFLNVIPDLVMFLFYALANEESASLNGLRKRYYNEFYKIPPLLEK